MTSSSPASVRRAAAVLSFCLPGLGQLYAGRPWRGLALNAAFLLLLSNASTRLLVPPVAVLAAWEASRLPAEFAMARPRRDRWALFALAGGLGVFLWSVAVYGELLRDRLLPKMPLHPHETKGAFDAPSPR